MEARFSISLKKDCGFFPRNLPECSESFMPKLLIVEVRPRLLRLRSRKATACKPQCEQVCAFPSCISDQMVCAVCNLLDDDPALP